MIQTESHGAARHVVLDRADKRNAFDRGLVQALHVALDEAASDPTVECVVLRGNGPAFSAGIDLESLRLLGTPAGLREIRGEFIDCWNRCETMPKPTVAVVHGACVGASFELTLACDLRIVAEDATLGLPETRIGAVPDVGGLARLGALVGLSRAKELVLTSKLFDGRRAGELGLANRVGPADRLAELADELVGELLACSARANAHSKRILDATAKPTLHRTLAEELDAQMDVIGDRRFHDGVAAFARSLG
ncbi:MAG: enoyl-CoA hydratase/isomerase family protein [Solirubrobacteraceae bacterium]|nr:enoyl-CoA hydratase/isomerase family protein [Solirubrobacteraceae bacterium]